MLDKLAEIERRYEELDALLQDPAIVNDPKEMRRLGKARAELDPVVELIKDYKATLQALKDAEDMLSDPELKELASEEMDQLKIKKEDLDHRIKLQLIPKDPMDEKSVIVEVRPAAGGDEAGIFASELFRMYLRYAERRRWKTEIIDEDADGMGAVTKVVFKIDGQGAYSQLKYESGVHRVQRVPATESSGRTHTSTVTVAVLPEAEDVDVEIKDDDLEVSTFRSSSAGGQHMQKNETAIRIIHKPSGIVATCQDERSQQQNRLKALAVIRAKLYQAEQERLAKERGELRKGQIGSGDRSEKIRTYNFNQSRITDHRIGMDVHNIPTFLDGDIQEMIDALNQSDQAERLAASGLESA